MDTAHFDQWIRAHLDDVVEMRRTLHSHPELSRNEVATTALVMRELQLAGLSPQRMPSGIGVVCEIGPQGPMIGLRADMDALPVAERTGLPFSSQVEGVSHACGHDAHTAILLFTAKYLATLPSLPIGVRLVFQPAEEVMPGGALDAVAFGVTEGVSQFFALHCDPKIEVGHIGIRSGPITSAADHIDLRVHSPGGHTSRPHLTADLVYALGTVITGLPGLLSRRVDPRSGTTMVWGAVHSGNAANAIPQEGQLRGTVRTGDHVVWDALEPMVSEMIAALLAPTGVGYDLNYQRGVPPVVNDPAATEVLHTAVTAIGPEVVTDTPQSGGGEDFSWYLEKVPGSMCRLGVWDGVGPQVDLHQPNFDIDERALEYGVRMFVNLVHAAGEAQTV